MNDQQRILIIEDDLYTRDLYKQVLLGAGFIVETANNGLEGMAKIQDGGYALILTDAMMPKMNGLEVLNQIRDIHPKSPNGPVVLCTNLSGDAVIHQALSAGAKACFIKTEMNPDQLVEKVRGLLG